MDKGMVDNIKLERRPNIIGIPYKWAIEYLGEMPDGDFLCVISPYGDYPKAEAFMCNEKEGVSSTLVVTCCGRYRDGGSTFVEFSNGNTLFLPNSPQMNNKWGNHGNHLKKKDGTILRLKTITGGVGRPYWMEETL